MKDYHSSHAVKYEKPECQGFLCLEVLPFLKGKKWDEIALAYVGSLRPSYIRVSNAEIKCGAINWRVTVHVNHKDIIERIEQEVVVGLPKGVEHGDALKCALKWGVKSKQCEWHQDAQGYHYDGIQGKYYKITTDGKTVEFPKEGKNEKD